MGGQHDAIGGDARAVRVQPRRTDATGAQHTAALEYAPARPLHRVGHALDVPDRMQLSARVSRQRDRTRHTPRQRRVGLEARVETGIDGGTDLAPHALEPLPGLRIGVGALLAPVARDSLIGNRGGNPADRLDVGLRIAPRRRTVETIGQLGIDELVQRRQLGRRIAGDGEAEAIGFQHHHVATRPSQRESNRETRDTATDHRHIGANIADNAWPGRPAIKV